MGLVFYNSKKEKEQSKNLKLLHTGHKCQVCGKYGLKPIKSNEWCEHPMYECINCYSTYVDEGTKFRGALKQTLGETHEHKTVYCKHEYPEEDITEIKTWIKHNPVTTKKILVGEFQ